MLRLLAALGVACAGCLGVVVPAQPLRVGGDAPADDTTDGTSVLVNTSLSVVSSPVLYPHLSYIGQQGADGQPTCRLDVPCRTIALQLSDTDATALLLQMRDTGTQVVARADMRTTGLLISEGSSAVLQGDGLFYFSQLKLARRANLAGAVPEVAEIAFRCYHASTLAGIELVVSLQVGAAPSFATMFPAVRMVFQHLPSPGPFPNAAVTAGVIGEKVSLNPAMNVSFVQSSKQLSPATYTEVIWKPSCGTGTCTETSWALSWYRDTFFTPSALPLMLWAQSDRSDTADNPGWATAMSGHDLVAAELYWVERDLPLAFTISPGPQGLSYAYLQGETWADICLSNRFCKTIAVKVADPAYFQHQEGMLCEMKMLDSSYLYTGHITPLSKEGVCFFHRLVVNGKPGVVQASFYVKTSDGLRKTASVVKSLGVSAGDASSQQVRMVRLRTGLDSNRLDPGRGDIKLAISQAVPGLLASNIDVIRVSSSSTGGVPQVAGRNAEAQALQCGTGSQKTDLELQFQSNGQDMSDQYGQLLQQATAPGSSLSSDLCGVVEASSIWRDAAPQSSSWPVGFAPTMYFHQTPGLADIVGATSLSFANTSVADSVCYFNHVCQTMLIRFSDAQSTLDTIYNRYPASRYSLVLEVTVNSAKDAIAGTAHAASDFRIIQTNTDLGASVPFSLSQGGLADANDASVPGNWFALYRFLIYRDSAASGDVYDLDLVFTPKVLDKSIGSATVASLPAASQTFRIRNKPMSALSNGHLIEYHSAVAMMMPAQTSDAAFTPSVLQLLQVNYSLPDYYIIVTLDTQVSNVASAQAAPTLVSELCHTGAVPAPPERFIFFIVCNTTRWKERNAGTCPDPDPVMANFIGDFASPATNNLHSSFCDPTEFLRFYAAVDKGPWEVKSKSTDEDDSPWWVLLFLAFLCCVSGGAVFARGIRMKRKNKELREHVQRQNPVDTELAPFVRGSTPPPLPPPPRGPIGSGIVPPTGGTASPAGGSSPQAGAGATADETSAEVVQLQREIDILENQKTAIDELQAEQPAAGAAAPPQVPAQQQQQQAGARPSQLPPFPPERVNQDGPVEQTVNLE